MKDTKINEAKAKLLEMNELIKQLDESMRETAIQLLVLLYFQGADGSRKPTRIAGGDNKDPAKLAASNTDDLGDFIASFEQGKPADNVILLVAWLYSHYGAYPVSAKEVQELGDSSGLVIPNRPDNTMRQAKTEGKNLFIQQGKAFRLTVSGELYVKSKFNVKKGNKPLPKG
jgi:hypothetical protein